MGLLSGIKTAGGYVVNFKVKKWVDYDQIKYSYQKISGITVALFQPEQAERTETFEEALKRLNLTETDLSARKSEFTRLMIIYILFAVAVFSYSIWIVYANSNILGFCMGFCITVYALTYAFRYHFWIYQIKNKKLGCTIRDWFVN